MTELRRSRAGFDWICSALSKLRQQVCINVSEPGVQASELIGHRRMLGVMLELDTNLEMRRGKPQDWHVLESGPDTVCGLIASSSILRRALQAADETLMYSASCPSTTMLRESGWLNGQDYLLQIMLHSVRALQSRPIRARVAE